MVIGMKKYLQIILINPNQFYNIILILKNQSKNGKVLVKLNPNLDIVKVTLELLVMEAFSTRGRINGLICTKHMAMVGDTFRNQSQCIMC